MTQSRKVRVLLDTCVLIHVLNGRKLELQCLAQLAVTGAELFTCAVNVAELHAGMRSGEEIRTERLLSSMECLPISASTAQRAGDLVRSRRKLGRTHTLDDMMIAAAAIGRGCMVWTENRRDFDVPGVKLLPEG